MQSFQWFDECYYTFFIIPAEVVTKAMLKAFGVNIIVGFLLSRWILYSYAVIGLLAGAIVFLILTIHDVKEVLKNLDYYIYAAT
jgi:ABC-type sulfate transport system permease component